MSPPAVEPCACPEREVSGEAREARPIVSSPALGRSRLARERWPLARAALADCRLCAHHCGVNRLKGERGLCKAGPQARVFSAQVEVADELELIPTFAIALSGCDLRCDFCITGAQSWNPRAGQRVAIETIAAQARTAIAEGVRTVMILGGEPTIHLPTVLELVAALPDDARLIWKTNAHASAEARALLSGLFDVWLADYKFGNDTCAARLAKVPAYTRTVRENLGWVASGRHFEPGTRNPELIIRHLLMPGHVECCWFPIAQWLAAELPGVKVSLRDEYWPAWQCARHNELTRLMSTVERGRAWAAARRHGLNLVE